MKSLTTDAFYGMGTNMTTGLGHVQEVFKQESMTQEDRDRFGVSTNKVNFGSTINSTQINIWLYSLDGQSDDLLNSKILYSELLLCLVSSCFDFIF